MRRPALIGLVALLLFGQFALALHDLERALAGEQDGCCEICLAAEAGGVLARARVHTEFPPEHHAAWSGEADDHHAPDHEGEGDTHADIEASYVFTCSEPAKLRYLDAIVFEVFPGTETLKAQFITGRNQGVAELNARATRLRF